MTRKHILSLILLLIAGVGMARQRTQYSINSGWRFQQGSPSGAWQEDFDDSAWSVVNVPHTWNDRDTDDDVKGYYRGKAWYRKRVFINRRHSDDRVIVCFEGANQEASLYVNGQFAGTHKGGYTRFCFDVTERLRFGEDNLLAVCVDNSHNAGIPPLSADFTFYGGIYRNVCLKMVSPIHISVDDHASSGVYLHTPEVSGSAATVDVKALLTNETGGKAVVKVENTIVDAEGREVERASATVRLEAGARQREVSTRLKVSVPHLWDIDDPYLYTVRTSVRDKLSGRVTDEVATPLGLRWFAFDAEQGFTLNGKPRKLIGTARHQDSFQRGNALPDEMHERDVRLLKDMGGNFLRVSHYPQSHVVMELCDRLGILTSVEIPVVNAVSETEEFLNNSVEMAKEMVRQDFNHPSVIMWGYMNEVLLRRPYPDGSRLKEYYRFTERVARALEETIRREDASRLTMMAYHNEPQRYEEARLTEIPMVQGWNLYQGWYEPDIDDFQRLLDRAHGVYKDKVLMVTEYGAGVDVRLHSFSPERFDFTQEYGLAYHRHYLREIKSRKFIAGSSVWNLNDFYSESRADAVPHVNDKGITSLSREKKDSYWFYKAALCREPVLVIGQRGWKARGGAAPEGRDECLQPVPVFTNAEAVELFLNGRSLGVKAVEEACAVFEVPFSDGDNYLEAVATIGGVVKKDALHVPFRLIPARLKGSAVPFRSLNVMLGSHRYLDDRASDVAWIPEKEYAEGGWGYTGGHPFRRKTGGGTLLGTDSDIAGTDLNPLFQTQRVGLESFRADVPDGEYTVSLYWAELEFGGGGDALVYNLGANAERTAVGKRSFGVSINGVTVLDDVDIAREYGSCRAVIQKFPVTVSGGNGLCVSFHKKEGEPVLNAIRIYRNY